MRTPDGSSGMRLLLGMMLGAGLTAGLGLGLLAGPWTDRSVEAGRSLCSPDMVRAGATCVDRFEASLWKTSDLGLAAKIRAGTVTQADLQAAGAVQLGLAAGDLASAGCLRTGAGCDDVYAVSLPGVSPARAATWFQALATLRNAGKRLPTNAEWQAAALGSPDGPPCVVSAASPGPTGTPGCVSAVGAFDMVGNLGELVADWTTTIAPGCGGTWVPDSGDYNCFTGPGVLLRGGNHTDGSTAGPLTADALLKATNTSDLDGFRGAR